MKTYDRNRNAITIGSHVMIANNGATGVIRSIHSEGYTAELVRRSESVEIEGYDGMYCPLELIRLGFH